MAEQFIQHGVDGDPTLTRDLLDGYLNGDRDSERKLFETHREFLVNYARRHSAMRFLSRHITPDDLVGETLLRALVSGFIAGFEDRGRGSLRAGLVSILDGVAVDNLRRYGARKRRFMDAASSLPSSGDDPAAGSVRLVVGQVGPPSPTSEARALELDQLCRRALTHREWTAWVLAHGDGRDAAEIGERLGASASAVRGLLLRAREKLTSRLCRAAGVRRSATRRK